MCRPAPLTIVLILGISLTACGDNSDNATGDKTALCAIETRIDDRFGNAMAQLGNQPSPDAMASALRSAASDVLADARSETDVAPAAIRADVSKLVRAVEEAATGDPSDLTSETGRAAQARVHEFCGIQHG